MKFDLQSEILALLELAVSRLSCVRVRTVLLCEGGRGDVKSRILSELTVLRQDMLNLQHNLLSRLYYWHSSTTVLSLSRSVLLVYWFSWPSAVVTLCTATFAFNNCTFCPHSVFMCFVWIWEQTAIVSLYSINWLVFITETGCVYCAVRTGSLYIIPRSAHTVYLCVLCGSQNKQRLFPYTTLTGWFS